jgi:small subunit ribosomal protein S2e
MAGVDDVYTSTTGHSRTLGNFVKAVFYALKNTYSYLAPDLWAATQFTRSPLQEHTDFLSETKVRSLDA